MTDDRSQTVLKRKAEAGRPRTDLFAMTPRKALRQALAKAAQDLMEMPLSVSDWSETKMSLAELPETLEERALLAILEGPEEGLGLIVLSPPVLTGLIEIQTIGRLGTTEVPARRTTRTDAAMTAEFIDATLSCFGEFLAEEEDVTWAAGFRYASWLEDPRPLGLILEDTTYRVIRVTVQLGTGEARTGQMLLCVPAKGKGPKPRPKIRSPEEEAADATGIETEWNGKMEQTVMTAEVQINAVLHRMHLPIARIMDLAVGTELPIPMAALEQLELEGVDGNPLARGRLGQANGHRAVRMTLIEAGDADDTAAAGAGASPGFGFSAGKPPKPAASIGHDAGSAPPRPAPAVPEPEPLGLDLGSIPDPSEAGAQPMGGLPPLGGGDLPALGDDGGLPPLGGDGELPPLGDGSLPPLGDGDLPPLGGDGDLPPLGGEDGELPDPGAFPMKAASF